MTRALYRWLLWLHPPAFRQEFAGEMLWIFEEASAAEGVAPLFADGLISLLRQWLLRSGSWKVAVAVVGGLLEITAGGFGWFVFGYAQIVAHLSAAPLKEPPTPAEALAMQTLIRLGMWAVTGVLMMVVVLVLWVRSLNGSRLHRFSVVPHAALMRRSRCSNCAR